MTTDQKNKQSLEEIIGYELMTISECFDALDWEPDKEFFEENKEGRIKCSCGEWVTVGGWFGVEHAYCSGCGKGMQYAFGMLPVDKSGAMHIDPEDVEYEEGKTWFPKNAWGFS